MSGVALWSYRAAGALAALAGIPYLLLARRGEVRDRLGGSLDRPVPGCFWIHAASLGEIEAAWPILRAWGERYGFERLLVSCTNRTALERLGERLPAGTRRRLAPLDLAPCVARALDRERPACLLFVETELWPEWIAAAAARSIPTAIISARLSDRTFPHYRRLRFLLRPLLARLRLVACRTKEDRRRWCAIGVQEDRCFVWGNTKYDAGASPPAPLLLRPGERFVLVAGSVREGEEGILDLPGALGQERLRLLVAPRHLRRLPAWEQASLARGLTVRRLSATGLDPLDRTGGLRGALRSPGSGLPDIVLLDRIGLLRSLYRVADAAFVGGTWVPIGGHNLFEPAREGVPVFFGRSTGTVHDAAGRLLETGGGALVRDAGELAQAIEPLLSDREALRRQGEAARRAAVQLAGAGQRTLEGLEAHGFPVGGDR